MTLGKKLEVILMPLGKKSAVFLMTLGGGRGNSSIFNDIEEKIHSIFIDIGKKMAVFLMTMGKKLAVLLMTCDWETKLAIFDELHLTGDTVNSFLLVEY